LEITDKSRLGETFGYTLDYPVCDTLLFLPLSPWHFVLGWNELFGLRAERIAIFLETLARAFMFDRFVIMLEGRDIK